jgi:hypothetical protein
MKKSTFLNEQNVKAATAVLAKELKKARKRCAKACPGLTVAEFAQAAVGAMSAAQVSLVAELTDISEVRELDEPARS